MHQRAPESRESYQVESYRPWIADALSRRADLSPTPSDLYVVVDDLDDGVAVLIVTEWPLLDNAGRLSFGPRYSEAVNADQLQALLDAQRSRLGLDAPDRPLRLGDAFFLRPRATISVVGEARREEEDGGAVRGPLSSSLDGAGNRWLDWGIALDITAEAREAAKQALFSAIAPKASGAYARQVGLIDDSDSGDS
jgi:hypothetical protein